MYSRIIITSAMLSGMIFTVGCAQVSDIRAAEDIKEISCSRDESHRETLTVYLPRGATIVNVRAYMRNSAWVSGGVPCRSDLGSSDFQKCPMGGGECRISWSKVSDYTVNSTPQGPEVSAKFYNWRNDNDRWAKLVVEYR